MKNKANNVINSVDALREIATGVQAHLSHGRYAVKASGHGSPYRFEGNNPHKPPFPLLSLESAVRQCDHWTGIACTIGGSAVIYDVRTGETISNWHELPEYQKLREVL